ESATGRTLSTTQRHIAPGTALCSPLEIQKSGGYQLRLFLDGELKDCWQFSVIRGPLDYGDNNPAHAFVLNWQREIADFREAVRLRPNDANAQMRLGDAYFNAGESVKAIECFTRAIELQPDSAYSYDNRGILKMLKKDLDGAIDDFSKAIQLDPGSATAH